MAVVPWAFAAACWHAIARNCQRARRAALTLPPCLLPCPVPAGSNSIQHRDSPLLTSQPSLPTTGLRESRNALKKEQQAMAVAALFEAEAKRAAAADEAARAAKRFCKKSHNSECS